MSDRISGQIGDDSEQTAIGKGIKQVANVVNVGGKRHTLDDVAEILDDVVEAIAGNRVRGTDGLRQQMQHMEGRLTLRIERVEQRVVSIETKAQNGDNPIVFPRWRVSRLEILLAVMLVLLFIYLYFGRV
mgnify:FL=1